MELDHATSELRQICREMRDAPPERQARLQIRYEAAIRYCESARLRSERNAVPAIAHRVGLAAFGACGAGIVSAITAKVA